MATSEHVDWDVCERCAEEGSVGVCLPTGGNCWAHAADADLDLALKRLGDDGRLDARGVPITQELLERLLGAAFKDDHGTVILTDARFAEATFRGGAVFSGVTFQGEAIFSGATFQGVARFDEATFRGDVGFRATFQGEAVFSRATFQGVASIHEATFQGFARFDEATFQGFAVFSRATFLGNAMFHRASFQEVAWFTGATFRGTALFYEVTFQGNAQFDRATFQGFARFDEATFQRDAGFGGATFQTSALLYQVAFQQARQLGPMLVRKSLVLDQAVFHERVQIEVSAWAVCCRRARFLAGVQLRVRWAQVVLDDADLAAPSILSAAAGPFPALDEDRMARIWRRLRRPHGIRDGRVQLVSLRRADVSGLTLANVDLHACRFTGAHHLDRLRLEEVGFAATPKGRRWTTRQTIAEEHHWRATRPLRRLIAGHNTAQRGDKTRRSAGWYRPRHQAPAWLAVERPTPAQVAAVYRALRKGREDNKDEPGAADFYYGEMEMRRHAKRSEIRRERRREHRSTAAAAAVEYAILSVYWLIAGYGLRAWRALAALAVVIGLAGVGFSRVGFHHPHPSQVASWLYALQATVSLEGKARQLSGQLTLPGELLRVGLRFTGPVLLGLALLSIRGRVKR